MKRLDDEGNLTAGALDELETTDLEAKYQVALNVLKSIANHELRQDDGDYYIRLARSTVAQLEKKEDND